MSDPVILLLGWCAARHILIDEKIRFGVDDHGGIGVYAKDSFISPGSVLVRIPKDAVLSVRTCSLAGLIPNNPYGLGAQLSLACALYIEILRGKKSYWSGYIETFPQGIVDLPLFWGVSNVAGDGSGPLAWLTGSEAGKILHERTDNHLTTLEEIERFYWNVAEPLLLLHDKTWRCDAVATSLTLNGFYRAFSLVSSRAFLVDAYHGLSMVPVADAFNHVVENHVHLETDYNVCPECGSLHECPHDNDGKIATSPQVQIIPMDSHDLYYEMVSNAGIPPNAEIFNTYGEELTNAQLLNQYGFILDENDNDRLSWTLQELLEILLPDAPPDIPEEIHGSVIALNTQHSELDFSQSQLVYLEDSVGKPFCLNDEGYLSHQLWTAMLALGLHRYGRPTTPADVSQMAQIVFPLQLQTESFILGNEDEDILDIPSNFKESDQTPLELLIEIGRMCAILCKNRKENSGKPGCEHTDLFDVLEGIPEVDQRTRLAFSILINERSLLDACEARWNEMTTSILSILQDLG